MYYTRGERNSVIISFFSSFFRAVSFTLFTTRKENSIRESARRQRHNKLCYEKYVITQEARANLSYIIPHRALMNLPSMSCISIFILRFYQGIFLRKQAIRRKTCRTSKIDFV
jgi:hypothetical protein